MALRLNIGLDKASTTSPMMGGLENNASLSPAEWEAEESLPLMADGMRLTQVLSAAGHGPKAYRGGPREPGAASLVRATGRDSELVDAPIYFEIVAEVPQGPEQGVI
uniref:Uncharacterized protein n=1 Tax=Oryza brachyantha TaxID=4533 RepID=J3KU55_ORYBR